VSVRAKRKERLFPQSGSRPRALGRALEETLSPHRTERPPPVALARPAAGRLDDPRLPPVQRQEIAARLGRLGGNRYLQRVIDGVQGGGRLVHPLHGPDTGLKPQPGRVLQREPEPDSQETGPRESASLLAPGELDSLVQQEIEAFLTEFQAITVTVRWIEYAEDACFSREEQVAVHPPYFMNVREKQRAQARERTLERYDDAIEHREKAEGATLKLIDEISSKRGMNLRRATKGKALPEDVRRILQAALDRDLIKPGKGRDHPGAKEMRAWLIHYGIGVDCSGFVSQALNRVMAKVYDRPLEGEEALGSGARGIKGSGTQITDPAQLRPGDTMHIPGHIRILSRVDRDADGHVLFVTAESRSGGKADVGPDRWEWRYEGETLQTRKSAEKGWKTSSEKPAYYRYHRLGQADQAP